MGFPAKLSKRAAVSGDLTSGTGEGSEGWGMGFFLVFFPQENHNNNNNDHFTSSLPFKSCFIKRTNYSSHLLSKAQSTISICALLIFCTLLLFTLSTFEPNNKFVQTSSSKYRRHLSQSAHKPTTNSLTALQGLGTLYTRGTRPMSGLVLCHVTEHVTLLEVKLFLRAFYSSGLLSKTDLMFVFHTTTTPESFDNVIREENRIFINLIHRYKTELSNGVNISDIRASFNVTQFVKTGHNEPQKEPIWGKKVKNSLNSPKSSNGGATESTRASYGSVVGFGVGELDPENSLSGFVDHVSMSLRRWACYPMILGRLRRNFKHVMLVDVKEVLLLGDPLTRVKTQSPESVFLFSKHNRKTSDKKILNPTVIMGGARGVRRLSATMLTEIVRAATHSKKKTAISESALLSRLVNNEFLQKSVHVMNSGESIHEPSSLEGKRSAYYSIIRRGNSNIDIEFMKHICSFTIEAEVYTECGKFWMFLIFTYIQDAGRRRPRFYKELHSSPVGPCG